MNTDKDLLASEKQAITGTAVSTDSIITTGLSGFDRVSWLRAFAQIETALSGGAATGITVEVIQADDAALTTNVQSLYTTGNIVTATANATRRLVDIPMPKFSKPYVGFRYTMAEGSYGAGTITAGFTTNTETPFQERPVSESHGF